MSENTRSCRVCGQRKPESEFYWHDRAQAKRKTECKKCTCARVAKRAEALRPVADVSPVVLSGEVRRCIHCQKSQPVEHFYMRKATGRRGSVCDSCRREQQRSYHINGPSAYGRYRKYDRGGGLRKCRICGILKEQAEFLIRDKRHGTRRTECKPCLREIGKRRYAANPTRHREIMRRATFGLDPGEYEVMLEAQGGVCAICGGTSTAVNPRTGQPKGLFVDHCHRTGAVRQLLCQHCNFGLGNFRDDPELMERAASYIRRFQAG